MLRSFFLWIRLAAKDAVLQGLADAAEEIAPTEDGSGRLESLRLRLAALPAPEAVEPEAKKKARA